MALNKKKHNYQVYSGLTTLERILTEKGKWWKQFFLQRFTLFSFIKVI